MTEWFHKYPGKDMLPSVDEEGTYLYMEDFPDWINVPDHHGFPGGKKRCLGMHIAPCPFHGDHMVKHYELEGPIQVAECELKGFLWYKKHEE